MTFITFYIILPFVVRFSCKTHNIQNILSTTTTPRIEASTTTTEFKTIKKTAPRETVLQQSKNVPPFTFSNVKASSHKLENNITSKAPIELTNQNVPFQFTNNNNDNNKSNVNINTMELISSTTLKQLQQSQALINQQNVMQLMRYMDENLRQMRTLEMQVTAIQEIFDSLHFTATPSSYTSSTHSSSLSSSSLNSSRPIHNIHLVLNKSITVLMDEDVSESKFPTWEDNIQNDLEIFSNHITKKLESALYIVQDLHEFFQTNITQFTNDQMPKIMASKEIKSVDNINLIKNEHLKSQIDENFNDVAIKALSKQKPINFKTQISMYHDVKNFNEKNNWAQKHLTKNYNKQQIKILNYDNNVNPQQQQLNNMNNYVNTSKNNELDLNAHIKEKIHTIKMKLIKNDQLNIEKRKQQQKQQQQQQQHPFAINSNFKYLDSHLKRIYFLSSSDHTTDYDFHLRRVYTSSIQQKYVFLLVDISFGITIELMEFTKTFISFILQLLCSTDLISVVIINDDVESMLLLEASAQEAANGLYWATKERKDEILAYIHALVPTMEIANHSLAFHYAFRMLERLENMNLISTKQPLEFVFITHGSIRSISGAKDILHVISKGQRRLKQPIVINTCAVILEKKDVTFGKEFLHDIAQQHYTKYNLNVTEWLRNNNQEELRGKIFILTKNQLKKFPNIAMSIFEKHFHEPFLKETFQFHKPIIDESSKEPLVSISHAVSSLGVLGVDLYFNDLIEDIVNYETYNRQNRYHNQHHHERPLQDFAYAFLVEMNGNTLIHPAFSKAFTMKQSSYPVDISYLENSTNFINIRHRLLTEPHGNVSTLFYLKKHEKYVTMERSYHWKNLYNTYVLCMVISRQPLKREINSDYELIYKTIFQTPTTWSLNVQQENKHLSDDKGNALIYSDFNQPLIDDYEIDSQLIYHRLDLLHIRRNINLCRYFHQLATNDAATLFLSSATFQSPFTYQYNNQLSSTQTQLRTMESIMAYLKDPTGLLANPGLKPHIRKEVNVLYRAMQHLKRRHQYDKSTMRQYIIRRYIASVNGVLQIFPGCMLNSDYDPTQRPWFQKALQHPGKIITTKPYLDAASSGYIITIAHTVFEGKANALHSSDYDQPIAVVAVDITYAYFYKMILNSVPLCQMANIKCLMFENHGYLIAHPSMLEPSSNSRNYRRPYEHLTHKESYLASDILNHKRLVRKLACTNYQNRTVQRYYVFNTSLTDILTNVVHGERTKYAIAVIRGSNIFAAVLNSTCDGGAFCPCSTIDRQCLNCKRMDPIDCECPCECQMSSVTKSYDDVDLGLTEVTNEYWPNKKFLNITYQYSYCEPLNEEFVPLIESKENRNFVNHHQSLLLPSCLNINCDIFETQKDCLAVMGCEWCQQNIEGDIFITPFCSTQSSCFNGIMGGFSPYGDFANEDLTAARDFPPSLPKITTYSAIGPVGGAIAILAIVIGFAIYCYRHNTNNASQEQFYMDSIHEDNYGLPLPGFNLDDCQAPDESLGGGGCGNNGVNGRGGNSGSCGNEHNNAQRTLNAADISPYHMSTGSSYRRPPNGESDQGYSTMTPHEDSSDHQCFTLAEPLLSNDKRNSKSDTISISTSLSSPTNRQQQQVVNVSTRASGKSPTISKKYHSPHRHYEQQSQMQNYDSNDIINTPGTTHLILAPVTVHRHMETSET